MHLSSVSQLLLRFAVILLLAGGLATPHLVTAQVAGNDSTSGTPLSLADAVRAAQDASPVLRIARDAVTRAQGQQYQARSGLFPQLNGSANYTRTLQSQFQAALSNGASSNPTTSPSAPPAPCDQYILNASAPIAARLAGLEQFAQCSSASGGGFGGINFSQIGFGSPNTYTIGLNASQNLFTGGRLTGQIQTATAGHRAAQIEMSAQRAQLILDATQAYYAAALTDRLLQIAQASLQQAEDQLKQIQLKQSVGNSSEFDLLRATVSRDNLRPLVIQRQSDRQIAYLQLEQLLHLPLEKPLRLTTSIEDTTTVPPGVPIARVMSPDTLTDRRAPVREAAENVQAQRGQLRVARSERLPSLALSSAYSRVAYPSGGVPPWGTFYPNLTVSLGASLPIFTGGRVHGDMMVAEANLNDALARLQQTRDNAALDARTVLNALQQAEATLASNQGTAEQAQRAFTIEQVRFSQGISTQLELNDTRNQLAQALTNRAQAARDVLVARVRLALLPDLPLQTQGAGQASLSIQQQQQQQAQMQQQSVLQQQGQQQGQPMGQPTPASPTQGPNPGGTF